MQDPEIYIASYQREVKGKWEGEVVANFINY
jgi:hypothetical protein